MTQTLKLPDLALLTLKDPKAAADIILGWRLSKEAIWTAIALVSVVITLFSTLSNMIMPVPTPLAVIVSNPFIYFVIAAGGFIATVYSVFWAGRFLGGQGQINDLMVLLLWLQALRAVAQVVIIVAMILAPVLASFLVLFVAVATLWIFVQFINAGLRLNSMLKALVALVIGAVALIVVSSFLLSLLGVSALGVSPNV